MDGILNFTSLVIALIALIVSLYNWRTADRGVRNDVLSQVRAWGDYVIDMLTDACGLCALSPQKMSDGAFFLRQSEMMSRASSLLDRGRLFFPNEKRDAFGPHKPGAFRGIRPPLLDLLILSFELTRSIDYVSGEGNSDRFLAFVYIKRVFVSAVQDATAFTSPATPRHTRGTLRKSRWKLFRLPSSF